MQTILEELAAGHVFCNGADAKQFAWFVEDPDRGRMSSLLFLSWSGFREPLWYTSYGDDDYDSYSQ